mmetsp:Transcript_22610/g.76402  ORF Transcript_22610/g.76402 Transcript_22610/m.76402 type:complete len:380 (+) Transcript_22610:24-1163(+)
MKIGERRRALGSHGDELRRRAGVDAAAAGAVRGGGGRCRDRAPAAEAARVALRGQAHRRHLDVADADEPFDAVDRGDGRLGAAPRPRPHKVPDHRDLRRLQGQAGAAVPVWPSNCGRRRVVRRVLEQGAQAQVRPRNRLQGTAGLWLRAEARFRVREDSLCYCHPARPQLYPRRRRRASRPVHGGEFLLAEVRALPDELDDQLRAFDALEIRPPNREARRRRFGIVAAAAVVRLDARLRSGALPRVCVSRRLGQEGRICRRQARAAPAGAHSDDWAGGARRVRHVCRRRPRRARGGAPRRPRPAGVPEVQVCGPGPRGLVPARGAAARRRGEHRVRRRARRRAGRAADAVTRRMSYGRAESGRGPTTRVSAARSAQFIP